MARKNNVERALPRLLADKVRAKPSTAVPIIQLKGTRGMTCSCELGNQVPCYYNDTSNVPYIPPPPFICHNRVHCDTPPLGVSPAICRVPDWPRSACQATSQLSVAWCVLTKDMVFLPWTTFCPCHSHFPCVDGRIIIMCCMCCMCCCSITLFL